MSDASQYPITTPYGQVAGYKLNGGFHNGIDYGCPSGTPVVVNGVVIGLSGWTGSVYDSAGKKSPAAAHLHVGRWVNGSSTNPGVGGGFKFKSAVVTEIHTADDNANGKYVRIQGDGASWVYLHLSEIKVSVNQVLNGRSEPVLNRGDIFNFWPTLTGHGPTEEDYKAWEGQDFKKLMYEKVLPEVQSRLVNGGDLTNFFQIFTGHAPTDADKQAWLAKDFKDFAYNKLLPEAKNRIK